MTAALGTRDGRTAESPSASFGQPWPGGETMVTETVVEQVVQALARGESVSAIARAYGLDRKTVRTWRQREGVIRPDVYEPTLNPLYREVLDHYGVVALPCRVCLVQIGKAKSSGRGPRAEDAAARAVLRDTGGGSGVSRSVEDAVGGNAHPRHDQAAGERDVGGRAATLAGAAARAVSLLPLRNAPRAPRRLRGSRGRVLQRPPGPDQSAGRAAVERVARPHPRPAHQPAPA